MLGLVTSHVDLISMKLVSFVLLGIHPFSTDAAKSIVARQVGGVRIEWMV